VHCGYFELELPAEPAPEAPPELEPAPALPEPMLELDPLEPDEEPEAAPPLRFD